MPVRICNKLLFLKYQIIRDTNIFSSEQNQRDAVDLVQVSDDRRATGTRTNISTHLRIKSSASSFRNSQMTMKCSCDTPVADADKSEENSGEVKAGQVPDWLDKDFVEKALRCGGEGSKVCVESCEVREATSVGDNYSSIVYRATAKLVQGDVRKLIIKCLPSNEIRRKFSNNLGTFLKEINVYEKLLPTYTRMHLERIDPKASMPWPRSFQALHDGLRDFIVLEDLEPYGYRMADRRVGLTEAELRLALESLGRFHAYSVAYRLEDPDAFRADTENKFHDTCFTDAALESVKVYLQSCIEAIEKLVRSWGKPKYVTVADQILEIEDNFIDTISSTVNAIDEETAVLCHGDFWVNNFLFRYEEEPNDLKLLDFQIVRYGSPAIDLLYLMATSTTSEVRHKHWSKFLSDAYLGSLRDTLEKLGHHKESLPDGPFSFEWLRKELASKEFFAFATAVTTTPAALASAGDAPDMDKITEDFLTQKLPFNELIKEKLFQERFMGLIDDFIESGLFH